MFYTVLSGGSVGALGGFLFFRKYTAPTNATITPVTMHACARK